MRQTQMTAQRFLVVCIAPAIALLTTVGDGDEAISDQSARSRFAAGCNEIDAVTGPVDTAAAGQLLLTDWPDDIMPAVYAAVSKLVQQPNVQLDAGSVRAFAVRHRGNAAVLIPYLGHALPRAEGTTQFTCWSQLAKSALRPSPLLAVLPESWGVMTRSLLFMRPPLSLASPRLKTVPATRYSSTSLTTVRKFDGGQHMPSVARKHRTGIC